MRSERRCEKAVGNATKKVGTATKKGWGQPRVSPWSERELREFRGRILDLVERVSYNPEELGYTLGQSPRGRKTRQILRGREPSRPYAEKFGQLEANPPPPKPEWLPPAPESLTGEAIPLFMVETGEDSAWSAWQFKRRGKR